MPSRPLLLCLLAAATLLWSGGARAERGLHLKSYRAWSAYLYEFDGKTVCFLASRPRKISPPNPKRNYVRAYVANWVARGEDPSADKVKAEEAKKPDADKPDEEKPGAGEADEKKADAGKSETEKPEAKKADGKESPAKKSAAKKPADKKPAAKKTGGNSAESVNEVSFRMGVDLKPGNTATVIVDGRRYGMFAKGQSIYVDSPARDKQLATAIQKGRSLVVEARTKSGAKLRDIYSLKGSGDAIKSFEKLCKSKL